MFTGLSPRTFRRLVGQVERRGGRLVADGIKGRQWSLPLADRVLLVATYNRTNLTMRQLAPLFGIKTAAVHRIIDRLGPFLALAPARRKYGPDTVLIVDGTRAHPADRHHQQEREQFDSSCETEHHNHAGAASPPTTEARKRQQRALAVNCPLSTHGVSTRQRAAAGQPGRSGQDQLHRLSDSPPCRGARAAGGRPSG